MSNIGYGTLIFGNKANFDEKLTAIRKIYKKYGTRTWTIQRVHRLWTERERSLINMNYLKQRNMIEDCGWAPDNKVHLWKLSLQMVLMCTEDD